MVGVREGWRKQGGGVGGQGGGGEEWTIPSWLFHLMGGLGYTPCCEQKHQGSRDQSDVSQGTRMNLG